MRFNAYYGHLLVQIYVLFAFVGCFSGVFLPSSVRLYSMKIWADGTLVRDYRPARQGTVYGLWEDTQGVFCPSATPSASIRVIAHHN